MPIGRQCASGLSLLLSATRCLCSSAAQGWNGKPSGKEEPMFQNALFLTRARKSSLVFKPEKISPFAAGAFEFAAAAGAGAGARKFSQMPVRSGFPSAVLGVGALRFGFPSAVLGMPGVG